MSQKKSATPPQKPSENIDFSAALSERYLA
jgi:hypothetical protein